MEPFKSIRTDSISFSPEKATFTIDRKNGRVNDDGHPGFEEQFILLRNLGLHEINATDVAERRLEKVTSLFHGLFHPRLEG
jgi:hypothetical protein